MAELTPQRLSEITVEVRDELTDATEPLAEVYERIMRRAGRHMARRLRSDAVSLTADMLPPDEDEVLPRALRDDLERVARQERDRLVRLLAAAYDAHSVAFDVAPAVTETLLEKVGAHAAFAVDQELRAAYRDVIARAAAEGLSIPNAAREIVSAVDGLAGHRAAALARTDLIGLANGASQQAATDAFAGRDDVTKVWLATEDDRTRETHLDANGQEVPLNEFFDVGGYPLMYPGDPDGPDEEVINCRCTIIYSGGSGAEQGEAEFSSVRLPAYPARVTTAEDDMTQTELIGLAVEERERTPWEGVIAIEGAATSDRRYLIPGEIEHRDLPLPVAASHEDQHLTDTVGRIEIIEHIPAADFDKPGWELPADLPPQAVVIWAEGSLDGSDDAEDARRQLENGVGVSIDLPMTREALINADTYEEVDPNEVFGDEPLAILFGLPEGYLHGIAGKIGGLSLASIAAFEETKIRIVEDTALVASNGTARMAVAFTGMIRAKQTLVASAAPTDAPLQPPRPWFYVEEEDEPTPLTVTPDGRVFGHIALWNTCHTGRANGQFSTCMYAPFSPSNYKQFHLGSMLCDDGGEIAVGKITVGTGHAAIHLGAAAARRHYDNTGAVVAFVRAMDGLFGIWVSGVVRSDATPEQIRDLRAAAPSGDWRAVDHQLELQAVLAVNAPGFPVPRSQLALAASAADGLEMSAMILGAPEPEDFQEALVAEVEGAQRDDVDMLVELTYLGNQAA